MEKFIFSGSEIIVLAQKMSYEKVTGIDNPLEGMTIGEINRTLVGVADQLVKKGYMDEDFEGNYDVQSSLKEVFGTYCDYEVMIECNIIKRGKSFSYYIYKLEDDYCFLTKLNEEYVIESVAFDTVINWAKETLESYSIADATKESKHVVLLSDIKRISKLAEIGEQDTAKELLIRGGCEEILADSYMKYLSKGSDYFSISFDRNYVFESDREFIGFIQSDNGTVKVEQQIVEMNINEESGGDYETCIVLSKGNANGIFKEILDLIEAYLSN